MGRRAIHPFPAKMAPDIAINHLELASATDKLVVLDPMCGSGTVLSEAASRGHTVFGFDVDPLAVLMSSVATQAVNTDHIIAEAEQACSHALSSNVNRPPWNDPETNRFAEYWFAKPQRIQLSKLSRALARVSNDAVRQALQIALSRIIITKTPKASLAADTSHSRPHRIIAESDYDVYRGFKESSATLKKLLDQRPPLGHVSVKKGDARALDLLDSSIDLVITSPPYLNAIDYLRGHKFSLIWLGYTIPELRRIRSTSIGAERALDGKTFQHVNEMVSNITSTMNNPSQIPLATIERYAHDLILFSHELHRICKRGAETVTVIGNSTLRGNYIQNDMLVQQAYEGAGFNLLSKTERELPENKRYLPIHAVNSKSSVTKRMRTEIILTMEKK